MSRVKRTARKEHTCILCKKPIKKNTEYIYRRVTPWDHVDNEYFFDYKAHEGCNKIWLKHGGIVDCVLPDCWLDFKDYVEAEINWRKEKKRLLEEAEKNIKSIAEKPND